VSFAAITLRVASQRVFIVAVVYFVIDSVRKLLDTPSYIPQRNEGKHNLTSNVLHACSDTVESSAFDFGGEDPQKTIERPVLNTMNDRFDSKPPSKIYWGVRVRI
jgi:hypothetical protein